MKHYAQTYIVNEIQYVKKGYFFGSKYKIFKLF